MHMFKKARSKRIFFLVCVCLHIRIFFRTCGFFICKQFSPALCGIIAYETATVQIICGRKFRLFCICELFLAAHMRRICHRPNTALCRFFAYARKLVLATYQQEGRAILEYQLTNLNQLHLFVTIVIKCKPLFHLKTI